MKMKKCKKLNLDVERITIPNSDIPTNCEMLDNQELIIFKNKIISKIQSFNEDRKVNGIMVQLPLPKVMKPFTQEILDTINVTKDVDGLTSKSLGLLAMGNPTFISSTPKGAIALVEKYNIKLKGKYVVIIGNSSLVGIPLSLMLTGRGATVTICHIDTIDTKILFKGRFNLHLLWCRSND